MAAHDDFPLHNLLPLLGIYWTEVFRLLSAVVLAKCFRETFTPSSRAFKVVS